ncbi:MAG TPA: zinc ribbon domain-containing protein [Anaerolineae bacterium]|nr:zinc ribbon domain-containing protein [Anaerolineae bacterium]
MPLYEYHCESCEREFELRRPIKDADAATRCPECESEDVTRKLSLFIAFTKSDSGAQSLGGAGSCGCGGACACGGHSVN